MIIIVSEKTRRIAALNDEFRKTFEGGTVLITRGVDESPYRDRVLEAVRTYDFGTADPGNDAYGERDFGAFTLEGQRFLWKVDYHDLNLEYHSPDPADPKVTRRVLTVMLSYEY